jgi:hypothetical protein
MSNSSDLLTKYKTRAIGNNLWARPETFTRYGGGNDIYKPHPFITGYWICLVKIPEEFSTEDETGFNIPQFLCSTAESFTPPTRTIVKSDITGFGGVKKYIVTGQDIGNTFNITFREYFGVPIFNIFSAWTSVINQYSGHITNDYKGQVAIGLLKPVGIWDENSIINNNSQMEEIFFFEGVMPETDPIGSFDGNIESNEGKTIDITFSYDSVLTGTFDFNNFYKEFLLGETPNKNSILNLIPERVFPILPTGSKSGTDYIPGATPSSEFNPQTHFG